MTPNSKELAHRIDTMVAFQNKEPIQFRSRKKKGSCLHGGAREPTWSTGCANLAFKWETHEYRKKPPTPPEPRTGYIFERALHQHPKDHNWKKGDETCFPVREVTDDDE